MTSVIYGVSKNKTMGVGYDSNDKSNSEKQDNPNTLQSYFVPYGKQNGVMPKGIIASKPKAKTKPRSCFNYAYMYSYPAQKSKFVKNYGKTTPKGPRKMWVPKHKIIYVKDILSSRIETQVMVPVLWMLAAHDGKKAYIPKPGT